MKIFRSPTAPPSHIDRRENAPVHWHKMGREGNEHLPLGRQRELLVKLRHMPVVAHAIGIEALGNFRKQHAFPGGATCAGHARLCIDDNFVELNRFVLDQRYYRQLRARCVASGIGDQPRVLDLAPMDLSQAVNGLLLQFWRVMLVPVPYRVSRGVSEAKISREVDDFGRGRFLQQLLDHLLRRGMRQGTESNVESETAPVQTFDCYKLWQREGRELREHVPHRLAGAALCREQRDFGARMAEQYAHKLPPGIARSSQNPDLRFYGHQSIPIQSLK